MDDNLGKSLGEDFRTKDSTQKTKPTIIFTK